MKGRGTLWERVFLVYILLVGFRFFYFFYIVYFLNWEMLDLYVRVSDLYFFSFSFFFFKWSFYFPPSFFYYFFSFPSPFNLVHWSFFFFCFHWKMEKRNNFLNIPVLIGIFWRFGTVTDSGIFVTHQRAVSAHANWIYHKRNQSKTNSVYLKSLFKRKNELLTNAF